MAGQALARRWVGVASQAGVGVGWRRVWVSVLAGWEVGLGELGDAMCLVWAGRQELLVPEMVHIRAE